MIQRYAHRMDNFGNWTIQPVGENDFGADYVLFSDHERQIAALKEELAWTMNRCVDLESLWTSSEKYAKHCVKEIKELTAEVERLREENKKHHGIFDRIEQVANKAQGFPIIDDQITGRQWLIEKEAEK